ncbi:hypothetical protein HFN89_03340 [Rhizobium laguerreae]|nr:hypothetical protein [Rhizobium laguerreae]
MSTMTNLPFARWRLRPQLGEPAYSYFARLVADEGHSSVTVYANEIGLNGRNIVPEEMLSALLRLPLSDTEKGALRAATPILKDDHYHIGNERLRARHISFKSRRYCPNCLAEAPHHRIQWDVVVATHCATHRIPLVAGRMGWWWPHFDMTPKGENMRRPLAPVGDRNLPFHDLLRIRLELGQREVGPFTSCNLGDIIAPLRHYARYKGTGGNLVDPVQNKHPDIEASFAMMSSSHDERVAWFSEWYTAVVPPETLLRGYFASTAPATRHHQGRTGNEIWDGIEQAQYEGFAKVGVLGRMYTGGKMNRRDRNMKEIAAEIGVAVKGIRNLIRTLDILPDRVWDKRAMVIDEATYTKIKGYADDLITLPETIAITGVPAHIFRQLVKMGFAHEVLGMTTGGTWGPRYLATEVRELVDRLRSCVSTGMTAETRTLGGYARRIGVSEGEVLARTLRGELAPAAMDKSRNGLRALYY